MSTMKTKSSPQIQAKNVFFLLFCLFLSNSLSNQLKPNTLWTEKVKQALLIFTFQHCKRSQSLNHIQLVVPHRRTLIEARKPYVLIHLSLSNILWYYASSTSFLFSVAFSLVIFYLFFFFLLCCVCSLDCGKNVLAYFKPVYSTHAFN